MESELWSRLKALLEIDRRSGGVGLVSWTPESYAAATADRRVWPKSLPEQIRAVADVVITADRWLSHDDIAGSFKGRGRWKERLPQIPETLVAIGRLREKDGRFVA